ncbi:MAG TPA: M81 family metallopeptidase [Dongiaceae bacterium]
MPFQVLTAEFAHETNTFNKRPTDYRAFMDRYGFFGADAIRERGNANTELAGFLDAGRAHGWRIRHVLSASAEPSGLVTQDAFDRLTGPIVDQAREMSGKLDGILLGLHGAMVTEFCQDGEGELLERLRRAVGNGIPIAVTLDLHANVTRKMCELAEIIVSYKTYPHIDMREVGRQAGDILHRTMSGEIKPRTLRVGLPMLDEVNGGRTDTGPMIDRIEKAKAYEKRPDVFAVSINSGFGNADIAEVGPTVLVTHAGDSAPHEAFAQSLADDIWERRFDVINQFLSVEEAAAVCKDYRPGQGDPVPGGPIIVADYADNPGGGGYGDSTELLRALLEAGIADACFGPMADPEAAAELHRHRPGDHVPVRLGGKTDPRFGGAPLSLTGALISLSDGAYNGDGPMIGGLNASFGPSAVLQVDGVTILVTSEPSQMLDLQQFRAFGIDPAAKRVVGLKSMQHFRAAFAPISGKIIVCDSGALCTTRLDRLPYRNVPRPIFPLDRQMSRSEAPDR